MTSRSGGRARIGAALALACLLSALVAPAASAASATAVARRERPHLRPWWYHALHLDKAHRTSTGKGVTIAVIDGFVDTSVPDLRGAHIDLRTDCHGQPTKPQHRGPGTDHGTAMTTLLVGQGKGNGPGGRGILGVAPDATVRFYSKETDPDPFIECDPYDTAYLMLKAARQGADIISYSGGGNGIFEDVIPKILKMGVLVVAAAGERLDRYSPLDWPAQIPGVVAVNAVDRNSHPWAGNPFSEVRFGFPVVSAPGVEAPVGGLVDGRWVSGAPRTGTSGATAIAAGIFALLKSRWPDATANQLIQAAIHAPGDGPMIKWDRHYGFGVISATYALPVDPTGWPDVNPLLHGPRKAMKTYPMSVYQKPTATPSASSTPAARSAHSAPARSDDGGVPAWVWIVVAFVILLLVAGLALVVRRSGRGPRGRTAPASDLPHSSGDSAGSPAHHHIPGGR